MAERKEKIMSFLKEIEKLKTVEREIYLPGSGRKENSAEHSWNVAMFVLLFEKDLPEETDILKTLKMALTHDLVEIYAGDTFAFDKGAQIGRKEREMNAAKKLFSKLPEDLEKEFMDLFIEFEKAETKEAKIAKSFDKLHPMLHNVSFGGHSWEKKNITYDMVKEEKEKHMSHNSKILEIYNSLLEEARDKGLL